MKISDLKQDDRNANKGTARGRKAVKQSLADYGSGRSILVDRDGRVIAGNKTLESASALSSDEVVMVPSDGTKLVVVQRTDLSLDDPKARELAIADNRASEIGLEWDTATLKSLQPDVDLTKFFDEEELRDLKVIDETKDEAPEPKVDQAAELQMKWNTARGQVWQIGEHRLMCGDSGTDDVELLFGSARFAACVTSPPYGDLRTYGLGDFDWDSMMAAVTTKVFAMAAASAHVLVNLGLIYRERQCEMYWFDWLTLCKELGWPLFGWYVWDKLLAMPGERHSRLAPAHEFIFHFNKDKGKINKWVPTTSSARGHSFRQRDGSLTPPSSPDKFGGEWKIPDSVVRIAPAHGADIGHPAMFSPAFADFLIRTWSDEGELIYDPFCGAATTIIAAHLAKRICYGMEIEPKYVAVALERLSEMGLVPKLVTE